MLLIRDQFNIVVLSQSERCSWRISVPQALHGPAPRLVQNELFCEIPMALEASHAGGFDLTDK